MLRTCSCKVEIIEALQDTKQLSCTLRYTNPLSRLSLTTLQWQCVARRSVLKSRVTKVRKQHAKRMILSVLQRSGLDPFPPLPPPFPSD